MSNDQSIALLLAEIDLLKSEIVMYSQYLDEKLQKNIAVEYCYESNRLEGGLLDFRETQMMFSVGLTSKPMDENLAVLNHYKAIDFIRAEATEQSLISEPLIKQIHAILSRATTRRHAGEYRKIPCTIKGTQVPAPAPEQLAEMMAAEIHWLRLEGPFLHPIIFSAEAHFRLQILQPFEHANGLCARLLMNMVLLSEDYPIANFQGDNENRALYYQTLEQAATNQDKNMWLEFIAKQIKQDSITLVAQLKQKSLEF